MNKIREMVRLDQIAGLSKRAISRALSVSRPVVSEYLSKVKKAGLSYDMIKTMDDDTLLQTITNTVSVKNERYNTLHHKFDSISKELKRTGVTLQIL